ncbi:Group 1 mite allergen-like protein (Cysteine protease) [Euroglyphus maynei]|uniref:Group 1 mite allergen-like protein (Cysteine protease) n=1 Tax=Euroglyphus maynei TaxID=6958 RepID=A0A1Y3ASB0_EURMA|nr:Group 1 mite allergen-like protein (Cysteine protease) [Euroglyphus maynei]
MVLAKNSPSTPTFSKNYKITGRILLPYAEINEPFTAYYDENANKSRIDYYGDLQLTVQRADLKQFYKIAYMVRTNEQTDRVCFNMAASPISPVTVQSVLPDLSDFQFKQRGICKTLVKTLPTLTAEYCEEWEYRVQLGKKDNKYVFILKRDDNGDAIPIFYLMMGYDSLLGSHYDKYEVFYESYSTDKIDPKIFDIYQKYECRGFPGPGKQAVALMNPMREFILNDYRHVDEHFREFIEKHGKNYTNKYNEVNFRHFIFLQNYRFIMAHNRKNLHYQLAVNHLADRTDDEMSRIRGKIQVMNEDKGGIPFDKSKYDISKIPEQWDWRLLGAVTPVKDQAICGSCWSFGATGTIEGQYFVKTGRLLKLSQQQLVDCSWSEDNNGCDGGEDFRTYNYIMKAGGISTEEDYGHYLGVDGKCHDNAVKKSVQIKGFYNVTIGDAEAMKTALYYHGPVSIAVDASPKTFSFYSHGIYYDPNCSSKNLDHQVLAVGFGKLNDEKYWLVKNSWSTYWGNDGYILISQKNNDCGVLTDATFPLIA